MEVCCPFVDSSSPTVGRESWLMVLRVSGSRSFQTCHREVCVGSLLFIIYTSEMLGLVENRLYAYADDSTQLIVLLIVVRKPADRPAVAASLNRDAARIQEWCNHKCMILKPNKTKALVVCRSRTVNTPPGYLVLSWVSIRASPNLDILGVKFDSKLTFEDHVRGIVSLVCQRIGILT